MKELLVSHYSPRPILIAERYKFLRRNQHESETVAQFVVELKRLALKCELGTFLEEALRDRLVCGLKSVQIQKKLLAERDLTFKKAFETAQSMEIVEKPMCQWTIPSIRSADMPVQGIPLETP